MGFRVDCVTAILAAPTTVGEENAALTSLRREYVERIVQVKEDLVVVLNPQKVLRSAEFEELTTAVEVEAKAA